MECARISSSSTLGCSLKYSVPYELINRPCWKEGGCYAGRKTNASRLTIYASQRTQPRVSEASVSSTPSSDEIRQWKWRKIMREMEASGSAVSVLSSLRKKRQSLPKDLVLGTLVRFKQLKEWKLVSEIMEWLRCQHWWDFSHLDYNMLMLAYGKQGNFEKAESTLKSMKKNGVPIDVAAYTALIEAYGKAGHSNEAYSIFKRMQLGGPEPSVVTYQTMMKCLIDAEKYDETEEIFQGIMEAEKPGVRPDQKMFHLMIYMYKKIGKRDQAYQLYKDMLSRGIARSTVTFNSLMTAEKDWKRKDELFNQVYRSGLRPDVVSYTQLISSYGKARQEELAQAVFDEMIEAGVKPTRKAYNVLLDAYARCGLIEEAKVVFKRMRKDRCSPDLCSYTTMLSAYVNALNMDGAEKFFVRMRHDGFTPNVIAYGSLIKGYGKANDLEKMIRKYEEMCSEGIKANETIFTTLMDAYGRNEDFGSAVIWFKEMISAGCQPDVKAKNILLSLAQTVEEKQEAKELIESLQ